MLPLRSRRRSFDIARIDRAEVLLPDNGPAVFRRLEIEVDKFMHGAAMQET